MDRRTLAAWATALSCLAPAATGQEGPLLRGADTLPTRDELPAELTGARLQLIEGDLLRKMVALSKAALGGRSRLSPRDRLLLAKIDDLTALTTIGFRGQPSRASALVYASPGAAQAMFEQARTELPAEPAPPSDLVLAANALVILDLGGLTPAAQDTLRAALRRRLSARAGTVRWETPAREGAPADDGSAPDPAPAAEQPPPAAESPRPLPGWFVDLPPAQRPALPAGVVPDQAPGTYLHQTTGVALVWQASATLRAGSIEQAGADARTLRTVQVRGFLIGRDEVTWEQYLAFCTATGRRPPARPDWHTDPRQPAVNVSWQDATDYCAWANLRLPTADEWELAARGAEGRRHPWGAEAPDRTRANLGDADDGWEGAAPVGSFPAGTAPCGARDMAGNVWEWVADWPGGPLPSWVRASAPRAGMDARCARGGSWRDAKEACSPERAGSVGVGRTRGGEEHGFRVALSAGE